MELQKFAAIFGEPKVDWLNKGSLPLHPFLFFLHSPNSSSLLQFYVTDFHSNTWESTKSILQLDDMRDEIGIGGAMSEFVDYIITSFKLGEVKLSMEGQSGNDGAAYAKLIAQKSKGMPVFSISLTRLVDSAASEAMAILSLGLFNAFRDVQCSLVKEQERALQLANIIAAEKVKSESIQSQLGHYTKKQKLHNKNISANADVSAASLSTGLQHSPGKPMVHDIGSTKATNRVVPAYRRAKTRGALLQDSEDDSEQERSLQLTKNIPDVKEKSENVQNQLGQNTEEQGLQNMNTLANADGLQSSLDKPVVQENGSTKVTNRVVPAHRRTKTRGARLQDSEDDRGL